jgi:hypothetical protein
MRRLLPLTLGAALLAAPLAPAADVLDLSRVSSEAAFVVHVDLRSLLGSSMGSFFKENIDLDLDEARLELGLDPLTDLISITVYGSADDVEEPVVLLEAEAVLESALEQLATKLQRTQVESGGVSLDRWSEGDGHSDVMFSYLARKPGTDRRVLLGSPSMERLAMAVKVLRDEAPNMEDSPSALGFRPPSDGSFLFVGVNEGIKQLADFDPASNMAKLVNALVVEAGESQARFFLDLRLTADAAESATLISSTLQGFSSLATIIGSADEETRPFVPLLQGLTVNSTGSTVSIRFEAETALLKQMIQQHEGGGHGRPTPGDSGEDTPDSAPPAENTPRGDGWY